MQTQNKVREIPTIKPIEYQYLHPKEIPTTFVITEEHLDKAIEFRKECEGRNEYWDSLKSCLVATAFCSDGFDVGQCAYTHAVINKTGIRMLNTKSLIKDFIFRYYDNIRACLPFVIEIEKCNP